MSEQPTRRASDTVLRLLRGERPTVALRGEESAYRLGVTRYHRSTRRIAWTGAVVAVIALGGVFWLCLGGRL